MCEVPSHIDVGPLIAPGTDGIEDTDTPRVRGLLDPHVLLAVKEMVPPVDPTFTETDVVPCPLLKLHPEGRVQVYEVAPETAVML